MRRNLKSASAGRPYSSGHNSGGMNSITSHNSGVSSGQRSTPIAKNASGSCRFKMYDQNSTGSSYHQNNQLATKTSGAAVRNRTSQKTSGPTRAIKPNSATKNNRCCRRRRVNTLRQYAANRFGELSKNPFINFFRAYKRKHINMSLVEIASRVAKIWNSMTDKQKIKYQLPSGYISGTSCVNKRGGPGSGARRTGKGTAAAVGKRRRLRRLQTVTKPPPKERSPADLDDAYSDQTAPSSKSKSRSRSASASLSD